MNDNVSVRNKSKSFLRFNHHHHQSSIINHQSSCLVVEYFRPSFELLTVHNAPVAQLFQTLLLTIINPSDENGFDDSNLSSAVDLCSVYIPFCGGRTNHAKFLDTLFKNIFSILVMQEVGMQMEKCMIVLTSYIFAFNVTKKNITPYHTTAKEPVQSNLDNILHSTGYVSDSMFSDLRSSFQSLRNDNDLFNSMKDFVIQVKVAYNGGK